MQGRTRPECRASLRPPAPTGPAPGSQGQVRLPGLAGRLRGQLAGVRALLVLRRALPWARLPGGHRKCPRGPGLWADVGAFQPSAGTRVVDCPTLKPSGTVGCKAGAGAPLPGVEAQGGRRRAGCGGHCRRPGERGGHLGMETGRLQRHSGGRPEQADAGGLEGPSWGQVAGRGPQSLLPGGDSAEVAARSL